MALKKRERKLDNIQKKFKADDAFYKNSTLNSQLYKIFIKENDSQQSINSRKSMKKENLNKRRNSTI